MSPAAIKEFIHASPFVPFTIHTGNGRSICIPHPEFVAISPTGRNVFVFHKDDNFQVIDTFLITSVETKRKAKPRGKSKA